MRKPLFLLLAGVLACRGQSVLFSDTFDRPDSRNIDASLTGIADNTGSVLAADAVYSQPWLDPNNAPPIYGVQDANAANGGGSQILSNVFQLKVGAGTANAYVNHNFTNVSILAAGGFSVGMDVTGYNQATVNQGAAFGIGMTAAEAASMRDAVANSNNETHMCNAFGTGFPGQTNAVADFWYAIRGNNTLVWGSRDSVIGTASVTAKTGRISASFSVPDFNAGGTVGFEVFFNGAPVGAGTFTWTDANSNFIALDGRDNTYVGVDNFTIGTWSPPASAHLAVSPDTVAADNPALPVTLTWTGNNIPAGSTYQITADKAVAFPSGGDAGDASNSGGGVAAIVDGTLGKTTFTLTLRDASSQVIATATAKVNRANRPNVVVLLADDLGWGDLGCYGGEILTPNIDSLAANGARFRQFYQSARCSPTRCSLLTGLYPQQAAVDPGAPLPDLRNDNNATFAEILKAEGYRTYMAGKWHLGLGALLPESRGFQHVFRFANGQAHSANQWDPAQYTFISQNNEVATRNYNGQTFYQTDVIGDYAIDYINHNLGKNDGAPFAMLCTFGAPHFPLGAPSALADTYMPIYAQGWDVVRLARYNRQLANGVIDSRYPFPALGGTGPHQAEPIEAIPPWSALATDRQEDLARRMAIYAAMVQKVDAVVGRIKTRLQETGQLDNTLIMFMSDNGANLEGGVFGTTTAGPLTGSALANMGQAGQNDGIHYGGGWAHVGNTPLKLFKHFTHEGGIRAPLVVHWPAGFAARNVWNETPTHLVDIVSTIEDAAGANHPSTFNNHPVLPLEGISLRPLLNQQSVAERPLFVEHESNRMIRKGRWKLVTEAFTAFDSEFITHQKLLYDMDADPGETTDLAALNPAKVVELVDEWNAWSARVGLPADRLIAPTPLNVTPAPTTDDLFLDSFNRADSLDVDSLSTGMSGSRVPPLGTGVTWFEGFEGSGTTDSIQIKDKVLQMATGIGMSENGVNHNFVGHDILEAGGFSVSLRVLGINTDPSDSPNRFAGFGVGLTAAEAAAGNDIAAASPQSIRGSAAIPGCADSFIELDLDGNVKLWTSGVLSSTVSVGKTKGTLTAAYQFSGFDLGATVTVSAWFDGSRIDLDPASASTSKTFTWSAADTNYLALSARATNYIWMDNFAVRKLPVSSALSVEGAIGAGLDGALTDPIANPDGDHLDNFGEWAFGTDPSKPDDVVSATSLVLVQPSSGTFRFAHRRRTDSASYGLAYSYKISNDLANWEDVGAIEEGATPLPASPGYEVVTLRLPETALSGRSKLFLRIAAN